MKNKIIAFSLFSCVGITGEIFFTSFYTNINSFLQGGLWDWSLQGRSYIWMFFIYGFASLFFPFAMDKMKTVPLFFRLLVYAVGIYIAEFTSGFLLEKITGRCPWHYTEGLQIAGYIRLDYLPAWMLFAFMLEKLVLVFRDAGLIKASSN